MIQAQSAITFALSVFNHTVDLPTTRPLIIAHQGASGQLPSHTIEAYQLAVNQGADVIECDVVVTRDLHLVCSHESWLNATTNIADIYPSYRANTYNITGDGVTISDDFFTVDFTLEELRVVRRRQVETYRDPNYNDLYAIATLDDAVNVVRSAGRKVGLHLETKNVVWTNGLSIMTQANTTLEDLLVAALERYGYTSPTDPVFIQSFDMNNLPYLRTKTALPLVQLLNPGDDLSDEALQRYAEYSYGIGPEKTLIVTSNSNRQISEVTDLIARAHNAGLRLHAWTFRNEDQHLLWDYGQDVNQEFNTFLNLGLDGFFTDFPSTLFNFLNASYSMR